MTMQAKALAGAVLLALAPLAAPAQPGGSTPDDWQRLWRKNGNALPSPESVIVPSLADLGSDLENREWLMIRSKYHQIYYDRSADPKLVSEVYQLVDNLYDFLAGRSPEPAKPPLKVFLIPRERGRSRCSPRENAMRTGADADLAFVVSSLLHEETHLFNFTFLRGKGQDWWAGEFSCVYFQERARLAAQGSDIKSYLRSRFPSGPIGRLADLAQYGTKALEDAFAAMYFLEETYGRTRLDEFRAQCLREPTGRSAPRLLQQVYGKDSAALDGEWRSFYGWKTAAARNPTAPPPGDPLQARVTYYNPKASVQFIIRDLAQQAGLAYNFEKSLAQTGPKCQDWVFHVSIKDQPFHQAAEKILKPVKLRYQIENGAVVLYRK